MKRKQKTFYDWCVENNQQIYLDNWNFDKNKKLPNEYSYGSASKIFFKCPRGLHDDTIKPLNNITNPTRNCKTNYCLKCNSFQQWCIDNNKYYLIKLWDNDLNKKPPDQVGYNSNEAFYFKCERGIHESHKHVLSAIVNCGNKVKCHKCNSVGQYGKDNIENFIEKYWSKKNSCSPFEVTIGSRKKILINCQICGEEYFVRADHFANGVRHKGCSLLNGKSNLQRKVENYVLEEYGQYTLLHENNCTLIPKSPVTNYNMYFDNEIKELKLLIEVHGAQHYKTCSWDKSLAKHYNTSQEEVFKKRQFYDQYKKTYALQCGYSYIEVPYWSEKDESYKKLINDKINELLRGKTT